MPRPKMVYEWEQRRDEIYQLYITENKSLEEIVEFYKAQNFVPSKRGFQAKFKEWGFPPKHRPAHKDADLIVRIRELWEVNTGNPQMLEILRGEGWDLKSRELTKLRKAHNLMLREKNRSGYPKRKRQDAVEDSDEVSAPVAKRPVAPEIIAKRQARQARLQAESEQRLKAGTRRRRTKVWSGLPPDPVAPPRYPSELTMEECKNILGLDKRSYHEMRDTFESICRTNNILKKTLCGADVWKGVKEDLISRLPRLQSIFYGPNSATIGQTQQPMAFELICLDVTKKIRTMGVRITITEAKSFLRLTPQEARDVRAAFDKILKEDYFVSKLEVPREHWEGLKARWIEGSPVLQQKLAGGIADPDYNMKLKCIESVAADVQKRHRDQQTRTDPFHLTKSIDPARNPYANANRPIDAATAPMSSTTAAPPASYPSGPRAPAPFLPGETMGTPTTDTQNPQSPNHTTRTYNYNLDPTSSIPTDGITHLASQALANTSQPTFIDYTSMSGMQIDPTLLQAAALPQDDPSQNPYAHIPPQPHHHHHQQLPPSSPPTTTTTTTTASIPVYFRLSPLSSLPHLHSHPKVWLNTLHPPYTLSQLKSLALCKTTAEPQAQVTKIEGVANSGEVGGGGSKWSIDEDDELEAYLEMVGVGVEGEGQGKRGKATFVVEMG